MQNIIRLYNTPLQDGVEFIRDELRNALPRYQLITDVINGADAVKSRREIYLPRPNPADTTRAGVERYENYIRRAVFYPVTRRTLSGMLGALFVTEPEIFAPERMRPLVEDASGTGIGLVQTAKKLTTFVLAYFRAGIYVDFPKTDGAVTARDLKNAVPVINVVQSDQVINWRYTRIGAKTRLSLIVIKEAYDYIDDDDYKVERRYHYRVMKLNADGHATVEFYRTEFGKHRVDIDGNALEEPIVLRDFSGRPLEEIPFCFVGAETNTDEIGYPPLYDMAEINLAHYRNSADYEEAVFLVGQPTLTIAGLSQEWADRYYKNGFPLGAHTALPLPVGASADLLQVQETTMTKEAMEAKERQMVAIGAKLIEQKEVQRTATEARFEKASENSILGTIADNVSVALEWALYYAGRFMGISDSKIKFQVNKEFLNSFATTEARQEVVNAWQAGAISWSEMRSALRKGGIATMDDDQAKAEIAKEMETIETVGGFTSDDASEISEDDAKPVEE